MVFWLNRVRVGRLVVMVGVLALVGAACMPPVDPVGAEYSVVAGQAAFRYSLMRPPQRGDFTT